MPSRASSRSGWRRITGIRGSGGLERLSIDEIYVGRRKKFYTLVIDLDSGQIVWVAKGRGGEALCPFFRALRYSRARIRSSRHGYERRLLGRRHGAPARSGHCV
ncbi:MAG: transposase [Verrucomicrobia bacterium]|nr:transposase [Verrucomicrobiota bacterium]